MHFYTGTADPCLFPMPFYTRIADPCSFSMHFYTGIADTCSFANGAQVAQLTLSISWASWQMPPRRHPGTHFEYFSGQPGKCLPEGLQAVILSISEPRLANVSPEAHF